MGIKRKLEEEPYQLNKLAKDLAEKYLSSVIETLDNFFPGELHTIQALVKQAIESAKNNSTLSAEDFEKLSGITKEIAKQAFSVLKTIKKIFSPEANKKFQLSTNRTDLSLEHAGNKALNLIYQEYSKAKNIVSISIIKERNRGRTLFSEGMNLATNLLNNNQIDLYTLNQCITHFETAIQKAPYLENTPNIKKTYAIYAKIYALRGFANRDNKLFDNALKDYTKAITLNPQVELYYIYRAKFYVEHSRISQARKDLDEAIKLNQICGQKPYDLWVDRILDKTQINANMQR